MAKMFLFSLYVHSQCVCVHNYSSFCLERELALPVFVGWNGAWGAEGKPPVDPEVLPNASKLAKSAFALVFCAAGGGVRMRFRWGDEQKKTQ